MPESAPTRIEEVSTEPDLFFILGCQRSGTTLLRLVLDSHPQVLCFDELESYAVLKSYSQLGRSALPGVPQRVGFKIPRWTEQFMDPEFRDEGQPETCRNFYRREKILFLVRDVRDVVVSMKKLKVGSAGTWLEFWPPRILLCKLVRNPYFQQRYRRELAILSETEDSMTAIAALYWTYKTRAIFDYLETGFPVLPLFYDDLVREPRRTLGAVCAHLEIDWDERMLAHHELEHRELLPDGSTVGGTDPKARISTRAVNQWEGTLTAQELAIIEDIAGETAQQSETLRHPSAT